MPFNEFRLYNGHRDPTPKKATVQGLDDADASVTHMISAGLLYTTHAKSGSSTLKKIDMTTTTVEFEDGTMWELQADVMANDPAIGFDSVIIVVVEGGGCECAYLVAEEPDGSHKSERFALAVAPLQGSGSQGK